jgi:hypothetical protein
MAQGILWHGTQIEVRILLHAIKQHCTCELDTNNTRVDACGAHQLLVNQRALDGLLFARRMAERLLHEEFSDARTVNSER